MCTSPGGTSVGPLGLAMLLGFQLMQVTLSLLKEASATMYRVLTKCQELSLLSPVYLTHPTPAHDIATADEKGEA